MIQDLPIRLAGMCPNLSHLYTVFSLTFKRTATSRTLRFIMCTFILVLGIKFPVVPNQCNETEQGAQMLTGSLQQKELLLCRFSSSIFVIKLLSAYQPAAAPSLRGSEPAVSTPVSGSLEITCPPPKLVRSYPDTI